MKKVTFINFEERDTLVTSLEILNESELLEDAIIPPGGDERVFVLTVGDPEDVESVKKDSDEKVVEPASDDPKSAATLETDDQAKSKKAVKAADDKANQKNVTQPVTETSEELQESVGDDRIIIRRSELNAVNAPFKLVAGILISTGANDKIPEGYAVPANEIFWDDNYGEQYKAQLVHVDVIYEQKVLNITSSYAEFIRLYEEALKEGKGTYSYTGVDPVTETFFNITLDGEIQYAHVYFERSSSLVDNVQRLQAFTKNIEYGLHVERTV